jgi:hypothetical protein
VPIFSVREIVTNHDARQVGNSTSSQFLDAFWRVGPKLLDPERSEISPSVVTSVRPVRLSFPTSVAVILPPLDLGIDLGEAELDEPR